jgi:uncharacterized protein YjbJ (UPF0337 family)
MKMEDAMGINWDIVEGKWSQLKGDARVQWAKLTDDDWEFAAGQRDKLAGRLQERYGWTKEDAEKEMDRFFDSHSR